MWDYLISHSNPVSFCFMNFFYFLKTNLLRYSLCTIKFIYSVQKRYIYIYFGDLLDCATMTIIQF